MTTNHFPGGGVCALGKEKKEEEEEEEKKKEGKPWRAGVGGRDPPEWRMGVGRGAPPRVRELSVSGAATREKKKTKKQTKKTCNVSSSLFTCYNRAHLLPVV